MNINLTPSELTSLRVIVRIKYEKADNLSRQSNDEYWRDRAIHYKKILTALEATITSSPGSKSFLEEAK